MTAETAQASSVEAPRILLIGEDTGARKEIEDHVRADVARYAPRLRAAVADLIRSHEHRIKTLDSLKSSAQQFQDLVESSEQGILVQVDGRPVYANAALARTLGYDDPEELLALDSISDFMDGRALPRSRRSALQRPLESASPGMSVFRARRKGGRLIWLEKRVNEVSWEGRPARLWEMDENLRFTYFSDRIETIMGQPVSHWIGKSREELSSDEPEYGPKWRRHRADLEARSSLSYLSRLPVQSLKIDRSFVRDLQQDPRGESTIKAVVALAHALDLQVVAEGIETREQLEHVKRLGCDILQGFFLGRPMPADDLNGLLGRHQALSVVGEAPAVSDER